MAHVKQSSSARIVLIVPFQLRYLTSIQPEVKSAAAMTLIQRIESAQSELALSNLLHKNKLTVLSRLTYQYRRID